MIPTQTENPNGFHARYQVMKFLPDGTVVPPDPDAEYFVLRLDDGGSDPIHRFACRKAISAYAEFVAPHLPDLAVDLRKRYSVVPVLQLRCHLYARDGRHVHCTTIKTIERIPEVLTYLGRCYVFQNTENGECFYTDAYVESVL